MDRTELRRFLFTAEQLGHQRAALDAGVPLRDVQLAARHADPRTTTIYDRRRENFDRHAAYVVVAFVAGA
jgi:integrase